MATGTAPPPDVDAPSIPREPGEIVRSILDEIQLLLRKHVELAKLELVDAVESRVRGLAAFMVAGVCGLFGLGFLAAAAAYGLATVMPDWLARLLVAGGFLILAGGLALYGLARLRRPPLTPEVTRQTLKEDAEWARTQLQR